MGTEIGHGYTITRLCQHVVMSAAAPLGQRAGGDAGGGKAMAGGCWFSMCLTLMLLEACTSSQE